MLNGNRLRTRNAVPYAETEQSSAVLPVPGVGEAEREEALRAAAALVRVSSGASHKTASSRSHKVQLCMSAAVQSHHGSCERVNVCASPSSSQGSHACCGLGWSRVYIADCMQALESSSTLTATRIPTSSNLPATQTNLTTRLTPLSPPSPPPAKPPFTMRFTQSTIYFTVLAVLSTGTSLLPTPHQSSLTPLLTKSHS